MNKPVWQNFKKGDVVIDKEAKAKQWEYWLGRVWCDPNPSLEELGFVTMIWVRFGNGEARQIIPANLLRLNWLGKLMLRFFRLT